ncbi:MAG: hypothetical protein O3A47_09910 [Chloroflexi bacterium]|nr:hypothetical protein [Chloroflexota bacterium]
MGRKLSFQQLSQLRSELNPDWMRPAWSDTQSSQDPKSQREIYFANLAVDDWNRDQQTDFRMCGRPESDSSTEESHDFDYGDSAGRVIAVEVTRLLEPSGKNVTSHPRPINDLLKFWEAVSSSLQGNLQGEFCISSPFLPAGLKQGRRQQLIDECRQEIESTVTKLNSGSSIALTKPEEVRGAVLYKLLDAGSGITVSFRGPSGPLQGADKVVDCVCATTLPEKNRSLGKAKAKNKTRLVVISLDYPLPDFSRLSAGLMKAAKSCPNIDHIYLVDAWDGFPTVEVRRIT